MKHAILVTGLIAATLSGAAVAQKPGPHGGPGGPFALFQHDANGDGRLTRAEFDAGQQARFSQMDLNGDGVVTADERSTQMETRRAAAQASRFAALDANKDGAISPAELEQARGGQRGFGGPGGPGRMDRGPGRGADGARGGDLTLAAFTERAAKMFEQADANKDGVVTLAEVQAMRPAR